MMSFVKGHLPKTPFWAERGHRIFTEQRYTLLTRYDLMELVFYIQDSLGLSFTSKAMASLQASKIEAEVLA